MDHLNSIKNWFSPTNAPPPPVYRDFLTSTNVLAMAAVAMITVAFCAHRYKIFSWTATPGQPENEPLLPRPTPPLPERKTSPPPPSLSADSSSARSTSAEPRRLASSRHSLSSSSSLSGNLSAEPAPVAPPPQPANQKQKSIPLSPPSEIPAKSPQVVSAEYKVIVDAINKRCAEMMSEWAMVPDSKRAELSKEWGQFFLDLNNHFTWFADFEKWSTADQASAWKVVEAPLTDMKEFETNGDHPRFKEIKLSKEIASLAKLMEVITASKKESAAHLSPEALGFITKHTIEIYKTAPKVIQRAIDRTATENAKKPLNAFTEVLAALPVDEKLFGKLERIVQFADLTSEVETAIATKCTRLSKELPGVHDTKQLLAKLRKKPALDKSQSMIIGRPTYTPKAPPRRHQSENQFNQETAQHPPTKPLLDKFGFTETSFKAYLQENIDNVSDELFWHLLNYHKEELSDATKAFMRRAIGKMLDSRWSMKPRLSYLNENQLRALIQLAPIDKLDLLWSMEKQHHSEGTTEQKKHNERMAVYFSSLSTEQFVQSFNDPVFWELMKFSYEQMGKSIPLPHIIIAAKAIYFSEELDKLNKYSDLKECFDRMLEFIPANDPDFKFKSGLISCISADLKKYAKRDQRASMFGDLTRKQSQRKLQTPLKAPDPTSLSTVEYKKLLQTLEPKSTLPSSKNSKAASELLNFCCEQTFPSVLVVNADRGMTAFKAAQTGATLTVHEADEKRLKYLKLAFGTLGFQKSDFDRVKFVASFEEEIKYDAIWVKAPLKEGVEEELKSLLKPEGKLFIKTDA